MCGNADYGHIWCQDILYYHCPGPDTDVVRNANAADNLCVLANIYVVPDYGGVIGIAAVAADAAIAVDDATLANARLRVHDDGTEVLQVQVFSEAAGADDEAQAGAEPVLATAVPETEQFVGAGKRVFLLLAKEAQIPLDVILLRADPPLHNNFFECHEML